MVKRNGICFRVLRRRRLPVRKSPRIQIHAIYFYRQGDIREGKKTSLLISALNKLNAEDKDQLIQLIENPVMSEADVKKVKELFERANAAENCRDLAKSFFDEAKNALEQIKEIINESEFEFFNNLLDFVLTRKF